MATYQYQLKGGIIRVTNDNLHGRTFVMFSFYIYDPKSKVAAYCYFYADSDPDRILEADAKKQIKRHNAGVGAAHVVVATLKAPLNFKALSQAKGELVLRRTADSSASGTATITLDKGGAVLQFPIVADFDYGFPDRQRGSIGGVQIAKTHSPQLPKDYVAPVAPGDR